VLYLILPLALHACETWSVTLTEEHRLKLFEKRVWRGIFGSNGDEVIGGWRKLYNEELHNLYSLPDTIRMIKEDEMGRACSAHGRGMHSKFW
jgi:hypothetical protein